MYDDPRVLILAVGYGLWAAVQRVREWRESDDSGESVDALHAAYVDGEIDESELERRLDMAMDPRNERIRDHVEQVGGVGPLTSREIALSFESVDDLRAAGVDELTEVPNVGPTRAAEIAERF